MIDTDRYEKHTPMWYLDGDSDGWWILSDFTTHNDCVVAEVRSENEADAQLMADAPDLLIEVKRLRKLEAAVVGSWMRACDHRGPWHKALRYPCVELGYLTLDGHYFELSEKYQDMAKEWIREKMEEEE
tara:strand:+ start:111 stop:497 length:387 start_codon:yes stop_codon:yes gene_type:complete